MMLQAIVLTPAGGLASAECLNGVGSVVCGQCIVVTSRLDFGPYGVALPGDKGHVTWVNPGTGEVQITLMRHIPAMAAWENTFSLLPFETDELLRDLRLCQRARAA